MHLSMEKLAEMSAWLTQGAEAWHILHAPVGDVVQRGGNQWAQERELKVVNTRLAGAGQPRLIDAKGLACVPAGMVAVLAVHGLVRLGGGRHKVHALRN